MPKKRELKLKNWLGQFSEEKIKPFYNEVFEKRKLTIEEARAIDLKHKIATSILDKVVPKKADSKAEILDKPKPVEVNLNASSDIPAQTPKESPSEPE